MELNYSRQSQFELFPGTVRNPQPAQKPRYPLKSLTLSLENIIVGSILFIMLLVLFFCFGVERGKRIVASSGAPQVVEAASTVKVEEIIPGEAVDPSAQTPSADLPLKTIRTPPSGTEKQPAAQLSVNEDKKAGQFFTIQVASFKSEENAQREAMGLKKKGYDIFVLPKGEHFIVLVGKFVQRHEAKEFSKRLKNQYQDCLVRRF